MFCKYCGAQLTDNSIFCEYCGKNLKDQESQKLHISGQNSMADIPDQQPVQVQSVQQPVQQSAKMSQTVQTPKAVQMVQYQPKSQKRLSKFDKTRIILILIISFVSLLLTIACFLPYFNVRSDVTYQEDTYQDDDEEGEECYTFYDSETGDNRGQYFYTNPNFIQSFNLDYSSSDPYTSVIFTVGIALAFIILPTTLLLVSLNKYKKLNAVIVLFMVIVFGVYMFSILTNRLRVTKVYMEGIGYYLVRLFAILLSVLDIIYMVKNHNFGFGSRSCLDFIRKNEGESSYEDVKNYIEKEDYPSYVIEELINDEYLFLAESNGRKCLVINEAKSI